MPTFTFNTFKIYKQHFFKIFDPKARLMKFSSGILFLVFSYCVAFPVPNDYINIIKNGSKFQGVDNLFDYTIPLIAALIIFYAFLPDYKNKINELLGFYEAKTYNSMVVFRWLTFVATFSIGVLASHIMYFRNIAFLDWDSIGMALLKVPNILMLCSVVLFFMLQFKNAYVGLFVMLAYFVFDYISAGRTLAFMSLGAHSNNLYYQQSPEFYMVNRIALVIISLILVLLASKKHSIFKFKLLRR